MRQQSTVEGQTRRSIKLETWTTWSIFAIFGKVINLISKGISLVVLKYKSLSPAIRFNVFMFIFPTILGFVIDPVFGPYTSLVVSIACLLVGIYVWKFYAEPVSVTT